jgi:uncharacterized protein YfaS (alpha-2-macroglobulin family)
MLMPRARLERTISILILVSLLVSSFACGGPKPTPTPSPTPLPPQPPQVVAESPQRGEEQPIKTPVSIVFDQPMDEAAVEAAFVISPEVPGTFQWAGNKLSFTPAGSGFARATQYRVTINPGARSAAGLALPDSFTFSFRTTGYLEVASVQPAPGTAEVASDALITVMFNRPVVPLSDIQSQTGLASQQPLQFEPPIMGEGQWLNTSIYTFRPTAGFLPGTTYTVTIEPEAVHDISEAVLSEPYVWSFSTALPQVVGATTSDPMEFIGPSTVISVTFNMAMDHTSVQERFSLQPHGSEIQVPGVFSWDGKTLGFRPGVPLLFDMDYVVKVAAGAQAGVGGAGMTADWEWNLHTIELPHIVSTDPAGSQKLADPYTNLHVAFSSPMNPDSLLPNLTIVPTPTEVYTNWVHSNTEVYISFGAKPSTTYSFVFGPNIEGRYGHTLGQSYPLSFTTDALPPSLSMPLDRVGTYDAYTTTEVFVQRVNVPQVSLALYRLSRADFLLLNGQNWWEPWAKFQPGSQDLLRKWTVNLESRLNEYAGTSIPLAADGKSPLAPGLYYLEISAPGVKPILRHMLVVSHANVTLKTTLTESLVWVTDLESGQPMAGVAVVLFGPGGETLASGQTDADGVFFSKITAPADMQVWESILAFAGPADAPAVASTDWANGISPWQFNISSDPYLDPYRGYVYTDRAIYRPGQTVYFKGVLRADDDGQYTLPSDLKSATVVVNDSQGKEIYRADLALTDLGTVNGEFALDAEATLGSYWLHVDLPAPATRPGQEQSVGTSFQVAEYRKPEFVVSVSTDRDEYTQGDEIAVTVASSYYFGGPVANAKLTWQLMSQDYSFSWSGPGYYDFTDSANEPSGTQTAFGGVVTSGQATTDGEGRFTFTVPADITTRNNSQIFTFEATITDPSNQEVSGRSSAVVHKGLFYIGLAPEDYIGRAGHEVKVDVITVDPHGAAVPNIPITAILLQQNWYNVQQQADDGRFYWTWKVEETPVYTTTVTTDAQGRAVAAFVPEEGGSYRVRAIAHDARENEIRSSTYLWISSGDFIPWRQENNDRIELVTDKKSYRPGETARILIPSPFQGQVKALLTVERGHVISHQLLTLVSNSDQVELRILPEYTPNVYVSVVVVKGVDDTNLVPSYRVGYVNLTVATEGKQLAIQITPDRQTFYAPSSKASFDLRVTDYTGRGVETDLSLQVVDLAVLALTDNPQGTLLNAFYGSRGLAVRTGASLAISVDRSKEQTEPPSGKGGSGGREAASADMIRKEFLDTAYWNADVRTDGEGRAQVTVDLPDNLTTWRVTGKGVTADTLVGESSTDIMTSKDLLIRAVAPRFFVQGDQAQLGAVVHNNTAQALAVDVSLQGSSVTIEQATQRIEVPAQGQGTVSWPVQVGAGESTVLTWRAASGDLSDGLELTLPIYHYSTPEVVATAGQLPSADTRIETVVLPEELDPSQGELTVQIDPSLAAGMRDSLEYLKTYPYDCIEQTVSRFLPNVITYRALRALGIQNAELEAQLPQYVSVGLQRLYALQHYDGGWGWWVSDESNPFISAYVLLGMNEAARAGFAVDKAVMDRAAVYLDGFINSAADSQTYSPDTRAFVLYVLAEYGQGDLGRTMVLFDDRAQLSLFGKGYLIMALQLLQPGEEALVNTLTSDLTNAAILSATGAHWEEQEVDYWTMNTDTRTTAILLEALLRADPQNPLLPNVVRWLMVARKEGHWETTQETAWSVIALTDFMAASGELQADYNYRVAVNAKALDQGTVTAQDVETTRKLVVAIKDLLRDQANHIVLERLAPSGTQTGQGQLYYALYLRYYVPVEDVVALDRGIVVLRQYALQDKPEEPITSAKVGDVIQVKLTVVAPNDVHYLVVEDPLPAGCEALDTSLKTTASYGQEQQTSQTGYWRPYWSYFSQTQLRDEKVALFATYLSRGTYEYTYLIRASIPGRFLTMPVQAYEMYFPEVFGRSDGAVFTIGE